MLHFVCLNLRIIKGNFDRIRNSIRNLESLAAEVYFDGNKTCVHVLSVGSIALEQPLYAGPHDIGQAVELLKIVARLADALAVAELVAGRLVASSADSIQTLGAARVGEGAIDAFEATIGEGIAGLTGEACGSITGYAELEGSSAVKTAAVGGCVPDHAIALVRHWVQHSVGQRVASSTHCSPGSASQASGLAQITLSYPIHHHEVVVRPALHAHRVVDAL